MTGDQLYADDVIVFSQGDFQQTSPLEMIPQLIIRVFSLTFVISLHPHVATEASFISFPFLLSSSLPNCWNSPIILSLTCFLPSSLFGSLSFHHVSCLPYFFNPAHGEKKKRNLFSCQSQRLGHHPPLTPHTLAHHRLSPAPLHLSIKHLSSLICSIQLFADCFYHFFPLPAANLFRNKEENLQ